VTKAVAAQLRTAATFVLCHAAHRYWDCVASFICSAKIEPSILFQVGDKFSKLLRFLP